MEDFAFLAIIAVSVAAVQLMPSVDVWTTTLLGQNRYDVFAEYKSIWLIVTGFGAFSAIQCGYVTPPFFHLFCQYVFSLPSTAIDAWPLFATASSSWSEYPITFHLVKSYFSPVACNLFFVCSRLFLFIAKLIRSIFESMSIVSTHDRSSGIPAYWELSFTVVVKPPCSI